MKATPEAIDQILQNLAGTPDRFSSLSGGLDADLLNFKPNKKAWSANDILAHLRACADVWGESIAAMIEEDSPTLPHVSPRTWINNTDYLHLPFSESISAFTDQRRKLLTKLDKLDKEQWSRWAVVKGRQHTVFSQARRMAKHEIIHYQQIETLIEEIRL